MENQNIDSTDAGVLGAESGLEPRVSASRALLTLLHGLGTKSAFGIPGGPLSEFFYELENFEGIESFLCQHEAGAAFAAMGRAMAAKGQEVPICYGTAGPGITNLVTGVAAAFEERVPLFVITGNVPTFSKNKGSVQDSFERPGGGLMSVLDPVTAERVTVEDPAELLNTAARLMDLAIKTRKPVHLNLPVDVSKALIGAPARNAAPAGEVSGEALPSNLSEAIRAIESAKRPLVYVGNGVKLSGISDRVAEWSRMSGLPVLLTSHGKAIGFDHPNVVGEFGIAADKSGSEFFRSYAPDALIVLGASLNECSSGAWSEIFDGPTTRLQVDLDSTRLNRRYAFEYPLPMRIEDFLDATEQRWHGRWNDSNWRSSVQKTVSSASAVSLENAEDTSVFHPKNLLTRVKSVLPRNACVVSDIGNSMLWTIQEFQPEGSQEFFVSMSLGSMGSGIGTSLGIQSLDRSRTTVCVVGDCAMMMMGGELHSAVELGLPVKWVVLNDGGHGTVDHGHRSIGMPVNVRFKKRIDIAGFASSIGVRSVQIRSESDWNDTLVGELIRSNEPVLLDVWVDPSVQPPLDLRVKGRRGVPGLIAEEG